MTVFMEEYVLSVLKLSTDFSMGCQRICFARTRETRFVA